MIEINNLTTNPVNEEFLKKIIQKVLEGENQEKKNLSLAFIGQGRMRELNKKYRGKNRVTDVLSFSDDGLGEVVICLREVKKNSKRFTPLEITGAEKKNKESESLTGFNSPFEKELAACLIHGLLHLLKYDHEKSETEAKKMKEKQNHYLELCQKLIS